MLLDLWPLVDEEQLIGGVGTARPRRSEHQTNWQPQPDQLHGSSAARIIIAVSGSGRLVAFDGRQTFTVQARGRGELAGASRGSVATRARGLGTLVARAHVRAAAVAGRVALDDRDEVELIALFAILEDQMP